MGEPKLSLRMEGSKAWLCEVLARGGLVKSTSEGRRMIRQGAVRMDGERVTDSDLWVDMSAPRVLQVGKRNFARILPENISSDGP